MENQERKSIIINLVITYCIFFTLLGLEIICILIWTPGTWNERLGIVFALIGIYGLAIAFIQKSPWFSVDETSLNNIVSPNIYYFFSSNFFLFGRLFILLGEALQLKLKFGRLGCWGQLIYLILFPFLFAFAIFHILVVAVLSYIPVVIASAMVIPLIKLSTDKKVELWHETEHIIPRIKKSDEIAFKGFLIGIPAILASVVSTLITPFIS